MSILGTPTLYGIGGKSKLARFGKISRTL
jgi:hypothetical protein